MNTLFLLAGGLGLFLYGMESMSRSIQRIAGGRLKGLLRTLTGNRFTGAISGAVATAIFQSSTVTTVMVVSFVNGGLMALPQAIAIILGSHIGTTITAQLVAFNIKEITLPIVSVGAFIYFFASREFARNIGKAIFGFGLIFLGLILMTQAFDPLRDNELLHSLLDLFSAKPVMGFLAGIALTAVLQSSSVTSGITIALALSGVITFQEAVPLVLGMSIGTTITANVVAIKGSRTAKQAARAHFITNVIGAIIALILLSPFMKLVLLFSPAEDTARQIANSHTLFNVLNTLLFLPFIPLVARLTDKLVFGSKNEEELYYLEEASLDDVGVSLDLSKQSLTELLKISENRLNIIQEGIIISQEKNISSLEDFGDKMTRYQSRITEYLEQIGSKNPSKDQSSVIAAHVRILHEIQRIYDYEEKIRYTLSRMESEGRKLSTVEVKELKNYADDAIDLMNRTHKFLQKESQKKQAEQLMGIYESLCAKKDELRKNNRKRFEGRKTTISSANYFDDILISLEEISKKCRNVAEALIL